MRRTLLLLLAFPLATAAAFCGLTALTLFEFSKPKDAPEPEQTEPSPLAQRFGKETEALRAKRRGLLGRVTFDSFLKALNSKNTDVPEAVLLAKFRALVKKDPQACGKLLQMFLPTLGEGELTTAKVRVLTQACLVPPEGFALTPRAREGLYRFISSCGGEERRSESEGEGSWQGAPTARYSGKFRGGCGRPRRVRATEEGARTHAARDVRSCAQPAGVSATGTHMQKAAGKPGKVPSSSAFSGGGEL